MFHPQGRDFSEKREQRTNADLMKALKMINKGDSRFVKGETWDSTNEMRVQNQTQTKPLYMLVLGFCCASTRHSCRGRKSWKVAECSMVIRVHTFSIIEKSTPQLSRKQGHA